MKRLVIALALGITALGVTGCVTQQDLEDSAAKAELVVEKSQDLEDRIRQALIDNPPEKIEDGPIADIIGGIIGSVNAEWVQTYDNFRAMVGNARGAAIEFLEYLPELRANAQMRAANLRQSAENYENPWEATFDLALEIGGFVFGAGGIGYGVRKAIHAWRSQKDAEEARKDAETLVFSIEAAKDADPELKARLTSGLAAGNASKNVLLARPSAYKLVKSIKPS